MTEANVLKRYIGRAGQLRYKVAPWMMDRQVGGTEGQFEARLFGTEARRGGRGH